MVTAALRYVARVVWAHTAGNNKYSRIDIDIFTFTHMNCSHSIIVWKVKAHVYSVH